MEVNQICQLMGISKKIYYQSQEPQERLAQKYQALRPILGRLIEKHPSYGVPRLKQALAEQEGMVVNPKLLRKLLRLWRLCDCCAGKPGLYQLLATRHPRR